MLKDPDEGMELKEEVKERLKLQMEETAKGNYGTPFDEVLRELNLYEEFNKKQ